jgi:hypothetical protein
VSHEPSSESAPPRRLVDLAADECWSLAATRPVGRLAWTGPHGPTIVPINFSVNGTDVVVRTTAYSEVARECDDSAVAFEVDDIDPSARSGWSVLMRGRGHLEYGPPGDVEPDVWLSGPRSIRLRIEVGEITGRRVTDVG